MWSQNIWQHNNPYIYILVVLTIIMSVDLKFKLTENIVDFKTALASAKSVNKNETVFICNKDQVRIYSVDESMVSVVNTILKSDTFDTYEYSYDEEEFKFKLSAEDFEKIINRIKNNDSITISVPSNKGTIKVKGGISNKDFTLKLLDIDKSLEQAIPTVTYTSSLTADVKAVIDAVGDIETMSCDIVDINITEKGCSFIGSEQIGDIKSVIDGETAGSASGLYSISYIKGFIVGKTGEVNCELGDNTPLHINIILKHGTIDLYIAPRQRS